MRHETIAKRDKSPVEAAVSAAILNPAQATRLPRQRARSRRIGGFTLAELLVATGVLVLLVFLATQLLNTAARVTTLGHKQMDADSQARQLLDRMAIDFAQMIKRRDVDYYVKSNGGSGLRTVLQPGNDQIAFYSAVPGFYPTSSYQSPVSLVAYRVNSASNKLERMGKGLLWNAATPTPGPVVFIPIPLASPLPLGDLQAPTPTPTPMNPAWPEAAICTPTPCPWLDSEIIGPQVFRFEYYYLLKGQVANGTTYDPVFTDTPWDTRIPFDTTVSGMRDVAAIVVDIALIDPKSKVLLTAANIATLAGGFIDFGASAAAGCPTPNWQAPGELLRQWQCVLDGTNGLPRTAISGIRLYERVFYLSPGTQ